MHRFKVHGLLKTILDLDHNSSAFDLHGICGTIAGISRNTGKHRKSSDHTNRRKEEYQTCYTAMQTQTLYG